MDFCRTSNNVILNSEAELLLAQLDILLDTNKGEVLGDPNFGSDYDKFLHELNIGNKYIEDYVRFNIESNVELMGWELDVDVQFLLGSLNDIILLTISLKKHTDIYTKIYKIDTSVIDEIK